MTDRLKLDKAELSKFCRKHHIHKLAVFGSSIRDDFDKTSDVDVLVEFISGQTPGLFKLSDIEDELTTLFGGHKADVRTPEDLSRYFREKVMAEAEVQYVQG